MRILALSDTHFGYMYGNTASARQQSIENMFMAFERTLEIAHSKDVELVLHGGDMFNRSKPPKNIVSKAYKIIEKFVKTGMKFVAIPGNHDKSKLPETLMSHFNKDLYLVNRLSRLDFDEISILALPFNLEDPKEALKNILDEIKNHPQRSFIILCHQLFDGAKFGPHQFIFRNRKDALLTQLFPSNAKMFISGHIHRSQKLQNDRVIYTGSTERTSFMEVIEPKGCLVIDIEKNLESVEFIELPSENMTVKEVDIEDSKMISSNLDSLEIKSDVRTQLRLIGRELRHEEIKFLWSYFPSKEYPLLTFTPRTPTVRLKPLYSNSYFQLNI
ncbi:MAG: metallophosphoesterase family protein [Candidatus Heimdallarchaeaceae archaeon]